MKSTVLKANKELASQISNDLLARTGKGDRPLFTKIETSNGYEIKSIVKETVVFRFTDDNGMKTIDYEERLITIC